MGVSWNGKALTSSQLSVALSGETGSGLRVSRLCETRTKPWKRYHETSIAHGCALCRALLPSQLQRSCWDAQAELWRQPIRRDAWVITWGHVHFSPGVLGQIQFPLWIKAHPGTRSNFFCLNPWVEWTTRNSPLTNPNSTRLSLVGSTHPKNS